ncbi:CobW family GTP-binding protein [Cupriavidus sp. IDO]|uniref:CobW family GTP-binding protein n=1 Tax=Cupriavidus sp. IDO TaxID=1539142 RepID=UPI000578EE63|nr:GTP-binding protein [Cupriavidus sp. IDO]KWR88431.1 cobalamin biosynthesis protein CobW [Cupriavidus sp. IDO]
MNAQTPIPLVVVGGYLGAGKTTLLNRLLANAGGRRVAVLVNDFGEVNIDAALIRMRSDDVIQLENGCICCSIGGRLAEALVAIGARAERPELLVIEASGVSDPVRIAQVGLLDPAFRLNAIVVAVDAQDIHAHLQDPQVGDMVHRQIAGATALVLTKADLAGAPATAGAVRTASAIAPRATVLEAQRGDLPLSVFLDAAPLPPPTAGALLGASGHWQRPAGQAITSFSYRTGRRFDKGQLRQALRDLPVRLLRAKGIVRLEAGAHPHELHLVGGRMRISALPASAEAESALVFIGCFAPGEEDVVRGHLEQALVAA